MNERAGGGGGSENDKDMGCWMDSWSRILSGNQGRGNNKASCAAKARASGHKYYGVQDGDECYTGNNEDFRKYGPAWGNCPDTGGPWKEHVWQVSDATLTNVILNASANAYRKYGTTLNGLLQTSSPVFSSTQTNEQYYWIWGTDTGSEAITTFSCFIPGTFQQATYDEDMNTIAGAPMIRYSSTASKLRISPCDQGPAVAGTPGAYKDACLLDLFISSGGDQNKGTIVGNLQFLNQYGTEAKGGRNGIAKYLKSLYDLATTGVNTGNFVTSTLDAATNMPKNYATISREETINNAAMMMFGMKGIISPCESLGPGPGGSIVIKSKTAPLDNTCLTYLWNNTDSDRDRYDEDRSRDTLLPNTYERIADRFSGLRAGEPATNASGSARFRTCTEQGSEYPGNSGKTLPWNTYSIQTAQSQMNLIHKVANYAGVGSADQKVGLKMCYGIESPA